MQLPCKRGKSTEGINAMIIHVFLFFLSLASKVVISSIMSPKMGKIWKDAIRWIINYSNISSLNKDNWWWITQDRTHWSSGSQVWKLRIKHIALHYRIRGLWHEKEPKITLPLISNCHYSWTSPFFIPWWENVKSIKGEKQRSCGTFPSSNFTFL